VGCRAASQSQRRLCSRTNNVCSDTSPTFSFARTSAQTNANLSGLHVSGVETTIGMSGLHPKCSESNAKTQSMVQARAHRQPKTARCQGTRGRRWHSVIPTHSVVAWAPRVLYQPAVYQLRRSAKPSPEHCRCHTPGWVLQQQSTDLITVLPFKLVLPGGA
jgi:hypothetical protein